MRNFLISLFMVLALTSCTETIINDMPDATEICDTWIYKSGKISTALANDDNAVNHQIEMYPTMCFVEKVIKTDTQYVCYGHWKLAGNILTVISNDKADTVNMPASMYDDYLKIGNGRYIKKSRMQSTYKSDIIGTWSENDNSYWIYKDNLTAIRYYQVEYGITEWHDDYTWQLPFGGMLMLYKDTLDTLRIDFINDKYGRWGNVLYRKIS